MSTFDAELDDLLGLDPDELAEVLDSLPPAAASEILAELPSGLEPDSSADPLTLAMRLDPTVRARPHLTHLAERLAAAVERVEQGESVWLQVSMPPRMGKSFLASTWFPAWMLHRHPDWKLGLFAHSPTLATGWGRSIRRIIEAHGPELGIRIAHDAGAVADWATTQHGEVRSRSVGQSPVGLGFRVMLLDDLVSDAADAHSERMRDSLWEWWTSVARTRLEPPHLVVAIGTRWHEDDILARLVKPRQDGPPRHWEQIVFPAIAEEGDVLGRAPGDPLLSPIVPETPTEAMARWADIETDVGSYTWQAQYQQRPSSATGDVFHADWWEYWTHGDLPESWDRVLTSWDLAFKGGPSSDYSVGQRWGVKGAKRYLLEQVRGRWEFPQLLQVMRDFITEPVPGFSGTGEHLVEDKANGPAVLSTLRNEIPGIIAVNPMGSKEVRARSVTPQIEAGGVLLPRHAPWLPEFLAEFTAFPTGKHDDQVDPLTQLLARVKGPTVSTATVTPLARHRQIAGW